MHTVKGDNWRALDNRAELDDNRLDPSKSGQPL